MSKWTVAALREGLKNTFRGHVQKPPTPPHPPEKVNIFSTAYILFGLKPNKQLNVLQIKRWG